MGVAKHFIGGSSSAAALLGMQHLFGWHHHSFADQLDAALEMGARASSFAFGMLSAEAVRKGKNSFLMGGTAATVEGAKLLCQLIAGHELRHVGIIRRHSYIYLKIFDDPIA